MGSSYLTQFPQGLSPSKARISGRQGRGIPSSISEEKMPMRCSWSSSLGASLGDQPHWPGWRGQTAGAWRQGCLAGVGGVRSWEGLGRDARSGAVGRSPWQS